MMMFKFRSALDEVMLYAAVLDEKHNTAYRWGLDREWMINGTKITARIFGYREKMFVM
jgi:hypothetical protein